MSDDADKPVSVLSELEIEPSSGFVHRLHNKIERRSLTSHFMVLTWSVPKMVLLEFVTMVFHLFRPAGDGEGDKP